ncbi:MAG: FtsW/RodA/SpoVE family cell cycle protein, partial [Acidimicrobiales bacterium]
DTGFQNLQSLVSVANGGITGVGLGASRGKWGFLPYAHNDFIFAILAEEMGLVGGVFVVITFTVIATIGFIAASRVRDRFGSLLAVGITTWIVSQAFVNIGVVIGALPTTGVTLPLISLGGTSLIFTLAACGVLLNITRHA